MLMFSLWLMFCLVNFPRAFITDLNLPQLPSDCIAFLKLHVPLSNER